MRGIDFQAITDFVGGYGENRTASQPGLSFNPTPDEKVVFANYTDRYAKGLLAQRSALFSSNANEGTMFVPQLTELPSASDPYGIWSVNQTQAELVTLSTFQCPAHRSAMLREQAGRTTYRWQYAGNFSNVSPLPWQAAYHSSDLPMLFGTHPDFRGNSTEEEYEVSNAMQDYYLSFVKDPFNGPASFGWSNTSSGQILRFAVGEEVMTTVAESTLDSPCTTIGN